MKNRINTFFAVFIPLLLLGGTIFLFFHNPSNTAQNSLYPKCPTYKLFDIHCLFCGTTRSLYSLLHFEFVSAVRQNAFLLLILPLLIYEFLNFYFKNFFDINLYHIHYSNVFWIVVLIIGFLFMILRNIDYFPFNFFTPFL
ncbi:DUF2752 domain-containing protein [Bernardetia sp. ABR2-2B]|uniref:DUF2752 domain-containing protein n=1 Tax=Bernardetia sp. ABR2-2B TaxID=3127472 RepID=UPI0030D488CB